MEIDNEKSSRSVTHDKLRIVVIFRADLPMLTRAKGEVQSAHAAASVLWETMKIDPELARKYMEDDNQPKIIMEVQTLDELLKIKEKAKKRGVVHALITDAAHTVFDTPTTTCIGIGPVYKTDCNSITRDAKMRD